MGLAMTPATFAACCLAAVPAAIAVGAGVTVAWFNLVWVPRIAGED